MNVGLLGRSKWLLDTAKLLIKSGYKIQFLITSNSEDFYAVTNHDFEIFSKSNGIPFYFGTNINKIIANITNLDNTDVVISVNWINILDNKFIRKFKYGVLNAHTGDLPKYKGNACPNWAILNFESKIALTIHKMTEELDSGPIILKRYLPINEETYITEVYLWLNEVIPFAFLTALKQVEKPFKNINKPEIKTLRTFPRRESDSRIIWSNTTRNIYALIRASSKPFKGAFSSLENKLDVFILSARLYDPGYSFCAIPGQVCFMVNNNPIIATGDGMIEILECYSTLGNSDITKKAILKSLRNRLM